MTSACKYNNWSIRTAFFAANRINFGKFLTPVVERLEFLRRLATWYARVVTFLEIVYAGSHRKTAKRSIS
jgi:hypothetical protein